MVSPHGERAAPRARHAFAEYRGLVAERERAAEIAVLPQATWKGRTLYTITCHGTTGRGPHRVNVPEALLWSLIEIGAFRCPYHA